MNFVYCHDHNNQEPKPGDLLFLYVDKNRRNALYNFVGIVVSTSFSTKSDNTTECYNIETIVLKSYGTIVHRVLIWNPICIKNNYSTL
jgi:hypothetical protein